MNRFAVCDKFQQFWRGGTSKPIEGVLCDKNMEEELMSIENTPQLRSFLQMWMMSGGMVVSTIEGVVNDGRGIQLPEIQGRDFKEELVNLSELISKIVSRIE
jgi:hypothetical protein